MNLAYRKKISSAFERDFNCQWISNGSLNPLLLCLFYGARLDPVASEDGVGRMILNVSNSINNPCLSWILLSGAIWAGSCFSALAMDVVVDELPRGAVSQRARAPQESPYPGRFWSRSKGDDAPPKVGGRSAGTRGCAAPMARQGLNNNPSVGEGTASANAMPTLMLLAPVDAIAQTQSLQPTLAWYLREDTARPIIFRLYQRRENTSGLSLLYEYAPAAQANQSPRRTAGIHYLDLASLPQSPELQLGGRYVWQVELVCDPRRPSGNLFAQAELKVVASDVESMQANAAKTSATPGVTSLLEKDLWQDALAASLARSGDGMDASGGVLLQQVVVDPSEFEPLMQAPLHNFLATP